MTSHNSLVENFKGDDVCLFLIFDVINVSSFHTPLDTFADDDDDEDDV